MAGRNRQEKTLQLLLFLVQPIYGIKIVRKCRESPEMNRQNILGNKLNGRCHDSHLIGGFTKR